MVGQLLRFQEVLLLDSSPTLLIEKLELGMIVITGRRPCLGAGGILALSRGILSRSRGHTYGSIDLVSLL